MYNIKNIKKEDFNGRVYAATMYDPTENEVKFILDNFGLIVERCEGGSVLGKDKRGRPMHHLECKCFEDTGEYSDSVEVHRFYLKEDETDIEINENDEYRYIDITFCNHCGTWELND